MKPVKYHINLLPEEQQVSRSRGMHILVTGLVLLVVALVGIPLYAADAMPVSALEAKNQAKVSDADTLKPGKFAVGLSIHTADSPLPLSVLTDEKPGEDERLTERVHQVSTIFGYGVAKFLQIDLGIRGSYESISNRYDGELFPEVEEASEKNRSETAFAGVSLLAKFKVVNMRALKLGMAPFVESGAGSQAKNSIVRSEKTKGGWMLTGSYLATGVVGFNLNGGYRYREREQIGRYSLRNEAFYQGSVDAYINRGFVLFVAGQGRSLKVADESVRQEGDKRDYKNFTTGEVSAGFTAKTRKYQASIYGGTRLKDEAIGSGKWTAGMNLAYVFGGPRSKTAPKSRNFISDKEKEEKKTDREVAAKKPSRKKAGKNQPKVVSDESKAADSVNDWENVKIGEELNNDSEDYKLLQDRLSNADAQKKEADLVSEEARAERELEKLREAETKDKARKEAERTREEDRIRAEKRANQVDDEKRYNELLDEVREDTEDLPKFDDESIKWDGLN